MRKWGKRWGWPFLSHNLSHSYTKFLTLLVLSLDNWRSLLNISRSLLLLTLISTCCLKLCSYPRLPQHPVWERKMSDSSVSVLSVCWKSWKISVCVWTAWGTKQSSWWPAGGPLAEMWWSPNWQSSTATLTKFPSTSKLPRYKRTN